MTLTAGQQAAVAAAFRECASEVWDGMPYASSAVDAAVAATDTWQDDNSASYNSALPEAFRTNASAAQKSLLLTAVLAANYLLQDANATQVFSCIAGKLNQRIE